MTFGLLCAKTANCHEKVNGYYELSEQITNNNRFNSNYVNAHMAINGLGQWTMDIATCQTTYKQLITMKTADCCLVWHLYTAVAHDDLAVHFYFLLSLSFL